MFLKTEGIRQLDKQSSGVPLASGENGDSCKNRVYCPSVSAQIVY